VLALTGSSQRRRIPSSGTVLQLLDVLWRPSLEKVLMSPTIGLRSIVPASPAVLQVSPKRSRGTAQAVSLGSSSSLQSWSQQRVLRLSAALAVLWLVVAWPGWLPKHRGADSPRMMSQAHTPPRMMPLGPSGFAISMISRSRRSGAMPQRRDGRRLALMSQLRMCKIGLKLGRGCRWDRREPSHVLPRACAWHIDNFAGCVGSGARLFISDACRAPHSKCGAGD
jgi:hypothetical protein